MPDGTWRVALVQLAHDPHQPDDERWARLEAALDEARGADLVVLPELWAHGAFVPDGWRREAQSLTGSFVSRLAEYARRLGVVLHGGSLIERSPSGDGRLWNTAVVMGRDGRLVGSYRKIHRFGFGEGEPRLLQAGVQPTVVDIDGARFGLATCYDLRFPELFRELMAAEPLAFVVSASWPGSRLEHWRLLGQARGIENQAFVLQCNTVGPQGGLQMGGHSRVVSPTGDVIAEAGGDEEVLIVDVDLGHAARYRSEFPVLRDRRPESWAPVRVLGAREAV